MSKGHRGVFGIERPVTHAEKFFRILSILFFHFRIFDDLFPVIFLFIGNQLLPDEMCHFVEDGEFPGVIPRRGDGDGLAARIEQSDVFLIAVERVGILKSPVITLDQVPM